MLEDALRKIGDYLKYQGGTSYLAFYELENILTEYDKKQSGECDCKCSCHLKPKPPKPETIEEKFNLLDRNMPYANDLSIIAKAHYQQIFDKAIQDFTQPYYVPGHPPIGTFLCYLRQKLFVDGK